MSSIEPDGGSGELDGGEEVSRCLVVSRGDGTELLELGEEVLDCMARLEQVSVVVAKDFAVAPGRDDGALSCGGERLENALIGVERLVGQQRGGLHVGQQMVGPHEVVRLAAGEVEANGVAKRVGQGVDLGAQSTAGSADGLVFAGFFWAPALC